MSARDLIRRAVRGADPVQLLEGLTEANLHVQVIDVANDKMLQDVRGDTKAQSKFDDFAKTYKQPRFLVQIVDIDRDRVLKTNETETESLLHPNGRCKCFGEGRCDWCKLYESSNDVKDWWSSLNPKSRKSVLKATSLKAHFASQSWGSLPAAAQHSLAIYAEREVFHPGRYARQGQDEPSGYSHKPSDKDTDEAVGGAKKFNHREQEIGLLTGNMGQTPKDRCKRAHIRRKKNFSTLSAKVK